MQSHPATIASVPSENNGESVFLLRAHWGFTSSIYKGASDISTSASEDEEIGAHLALIDGPYGGPHLDFASFSAIVLIAGSTGITFVLPILLDLSSRAPKTKLPVKGVVVIWAVKTAGCMNRVNSELQQISKTLNGAGICFLVKIFVTADDEFVGESEAENVGDSGCHCGLNAGGCVCVTKVTKLDTSESGSSVHEKVHDEGAKQVTEGDKQKPPAYTAKSQNHITSVQAGRLDIRRILARDKSEGEIGVAVCGPRGMTSATRSAVAELESGDKEIYLHAESLGM